MASPPERVEMACQVIGLIESLAKATWPSQYSKLTPEGWRLTRGFPTGVVVDDAVGPG